MEDPLCFARVKNLSSLYYKQAELSYLSFLKFEKELPASYHLPWRFLDSSHGPDPLPEELRAVVNNCRQILSASVEG